MGKEVLQNYATHFGVVEQTFLPDVFFPGKLSTARLASLKKPNLLRSVASWGPFCAPGKSATNSSPFSVNVYPETRAFSCCPAVLAAAFAPAPAPLAPAETAPWMSASLNPPLRAIAANSVP